MRMILLGLALLACTALSAGRSGHADAATNQAPILSLPIADGDIDSNVRFVLTVRASDPDGDPLTVGAAPLPAGAYFVLRGDTSLDGRVSSTDALLVLQDVAALWTPSGAARAASDVTLDFQVDAVDAVLILQYDAGLLPPANVWYFAWTPTYSQSAPNPDGASYTIDFTASDGQASDRETIKIRVHPYVVDEFAR